MAARGVRALAALAAAALLLLVPAAAYADAPFFLPQRLTDSTTDRVLGTGFADADAALTELESQGTYRLWAVFVDSFDGVSAADWADATATVSNLGEDDLVLAVAVDDRSLALSATDAVPQGVYDDAYDAATAAATAAADGDGTWSQVVVDTAQALGSTGGGGGSGAAVAVGVGAV
ncbi:MAG TPA: methanol dehydrogenase, partial [Micrococcales bacterium]|nr:methanol dehydrogenase [Micrococcales bacterium]